MIVWIGPKKFARGRRARGRGRRRAAAPPTISSKMPSASCRARHSRLVAEQVLLGDHLQDRADVLGHAAVDQHEAVFELLAGVRRHAVRAEDRVVAAAAGRG